MKTSLRTLRLLWPREVSAEEMAAAMQLLASTGGTPLVLEALGRLGRVEHRLQIVESKASGLTTQLRAAIPGIGIEGIGRDDDKMPDFTRARQVRLSTARRAVLTERVETVSRAILTALAHVGRDEALLLQWVLATRLQPEVVPSRIEQLHPESMWKAVLRAPFVGPSPADAETRGSLKDKRSEPGWRTIGRIAVRAASRSREEQLLRSVLQAVRTAEAPGVRIAARSVNPSTIPTVRGRASVRLNLSELAALCAWPIGPTADLPVMKLGSRRLPAASAIPAAGRVVGESTWPGNERSLALSPEDSLRHLHVIGPTGTGKSTLLLQLIEQDMKARRAIVVIEPKGDLIDDVLQRIPDNRQHDVVLLDPSDSAAPVGLNPLAAVHGPDGAELVADQLLATFHGLYAAHWGPRTSDILHASLLTLARTPGMSLAALPLLLGDPAFRHKIVGSLHDPIGLEPFWASFEAWREAERTTAVAPVMNKLRPFLLRPSLRRVIGQATPRFQLASVFTERKILLVNLAKGRLGPEAASLLGALVLAGLWQTAQSRGSIPKERRHPVFVTQRLQFLTDDFLRHFRESCAFEEHSAQMVL